MSNQEAEFEQQRIKINRAELIARMTRAVSEDGLLEPYPGIVLGRFSRPTEEQVYAMFKPSFCVLAQGSKEVILGEETFRYDPGHYLISTVVLPVVSQVVEAAEEKPYLGFQLYLDQAVVAQVLMESKIETKKTSATARAMNVSPVENELLEAALKLMRLLDTPDV